MTLKEKVIKLRIIADLDRFFKESADINFNNLKKSDEECNEKEDLEIESIFMSYRNVIAGTDWDGNKREYETYEVK